MNVDPLLRAREGAALLGVSLSTFWRHVESGTIPPPVKFGGASRWPQSDFLKIIEDAKNTRRRDDRRCGSCLHACVPPPEEAAEALLVELGKAKPEDIVHCVALSTASAKQFLPRDCKMNCWEPRGHE